MKTHSTFLFSILKLFLVVKIIYIINPIARLYGFLFMQ